MGRTQRQYDAVLQRGGLQFEIEFAAKAFAQGQAPGAIDARTEGGVDHQVHVAGLVEEAFHHHCVLGREHAQGRLRGGEVFG